MRTGLATVAVGTWILTHLLACGSSGDELGSEDQELNTSPAIGSFVLYAERSVKLGSHDAISGSVGVAIPASSPGSQLTLADHVAAADLYAPSVLLGEYSAVHDVATSALQQQSHVAIHSSVPYPITSMPSLPLATAGAVGTNNVTITHPGQLAPGAYGALDDESVLTLAAGTYSFASVTIGAHAVLQAQGSVNIRVSGKLIIGDHVSVSAPSAPSLRFDVSGDDTATSAVATIGSQAVIHALISAPHGTIRFADHVAAIGAFVASDIVADSSAAFALDQGFPTTTSGEVGTQQLAGYFGNESNPNIAPVTGPVPSTSPVSLSIGLPVRDPVGLKTFVNSVSDPKNALYRKYLTNDQFTQTYGATESDYIAIQEWAQSAGLAITSTYQSRLLVTVSGTAGRVEQALHANLIFRRTNDGVTNFVTVDREPSVNAGPTILWISGLDAYVAPKSRSAACPSGPDIVLINQMGGGPGGTFGYSAAQLRSAYLGTNSSCAGLDGAGQVVGVLALSNFLPSDISTYIAGQTTNISPGSIGGPDDSSQQITWSLVPINGHAPSLSPDSETALDIEMVLAMAPKARVHVFEADDNTDDILHMMANDPELTIVTNSWGFGYSTNADQAITQMAARGITMFSASGDYGNVGDPGDISHGADLTLVGGTILHDPLGNSETTWNEGCAGVSFDATLGINTFQSQDITAGGILDGDIAGVPFGNVCTCFPEPFCCANAEPIPGYQQQLTMTSNGGSTSNRNYPDVSAIAFGASVFYGQWSSFRGTSVAAPVWAGFTALANQFAQGNHVGSVGFANPALYAIAKSSSLYDTSFRDIADGVFNQVPQSAGFPAVSGYDLATGWGSPRCGLITQLGTYDPTAPQTFASVLVHVVNGHDGVNDTSAVFLDVYDSSLANSGPITVPLKHFGDVGWDAIGVAHDVPVDISSFISGHQVNPFNVTKVVLHIDDAGSTDDWDVAGLNVELVDLVKEVGNCSITTFDLCATDPDCPLGETCVIAGGAGSPSACIVDLAGGNTCDTQQSSCQGGNLTDGHPGVVRLGPNGQGSFVEFAMATGPGNVEPSSWGGCASWQGAVPAEPFDVLRFEIDSGDDDLDSDSELDFDVMGYNPDNTPSSVPIESGIIHKPGDETFVDQTQHVVNVALNDNERCASCVPLDYSMISGIRLRFVPSSGVFGSDEWHVEEITVRGLNTSTSLYEETCLAEGPPGDEFFSLFCVSPCITYPFQFDENTNSATLPKGNGCGS